LFSCEAKVLETIYGKDYDMKNPIKEAKKFMYRRSLFIFVLVFLSVLPAAAGSRNISAAESRALLQENGRTFLLDVRSPEEYLQVRIEGARLIPTDQFLRRLSEVPGDRPILVYCAVGSRSSQVAAYLARQGYSEVYNMEGGIWGWQLRGFPVLKGGP
jgi:rhodanese-related sulfurtransferase